MKEKWTNDITKQGYPDILNLINQGLRFTDNVEAYTQAIFNFIADCSDAGHDRLIDVFKNAQKSYLKKCTTQGRREHFEKALKDLNEFNNHIISLQTVNAFHSKGNWNENSANTILLFALLMAGGYTFKEHEIEKLLKGDQLGSYKRIYRGFVLAAETADQSAIEKKKKQNRELSAMGKTEIVDLPNILLCDNHEMAEAENALHPEKAVFCLFYTPEGWQLNWYDVLGRPNFLPIDNNFQKILDELDDNKLPARTLKKYKLIKTFCANALKNLVLIFDDAERAEAFVREYPEQLSFLLTREPSSKEPGTLKWQLYWYDLQGRRNLLPFNDKKLKEQFPSTETKLHYDINQNCRNAVTEFLNRMRVSVNPKASDSSPKVATYILTHIPPAPLTASPFQVKLEWVDNLGVSKEIPLDGYEKLIDWLILQDKVDDEETLTQLKIYLMHLNPNLRREVDEAKQKSARKIVQKVHGIASIALYVTNKKIKLMPGTYILRRDELSGEWVLYQRQKARGDVVIDTQWEEWGAFRNCLNALGNTMPDDLDITQKNNIRGSIEVALNTVEEAFNPIDKNAKKCIAVNNFLPEQSSKYRACSFILTTENDKWALFYLNVFQKPIPVNLDDCPAVNVLLSQWKGSPESLKSSKLDDLNNALADFIPVTPLNKAAFIEVERFFATRPLSNPEGGECSTPRKSVFETEEKNYSSVKRYLLERYLPKKIKEEEPQKIDKKRIADFATMFGGVKPVNPEMMESSDNNTYN
ncbi:MAG: hypothetical protein Q8M03_16315 [Legionella sp.]|nr:hypothetical protein [Legionella sp.]